MSNAIPSSAVECHIRSDKELRRRIDEMLEDLARVSDRDFPGPRPLVVIRSSRERSVVRTKLQEAKHCLGEDLAAIAREHPEYLEAKPSPAEAGRAAYHRFSKVAVEGVDSECTAWEELSGRHQDA